MYIFRLSSSLQLSLTAILFRDDENCHCSVHAINNELYTRKKKEDSREDMEEKAISLKQRKHFDALVQKKLNNLTGN